MSAGEKIYMVISIIAAAGVFGICSVISNNPAIPLWLRIIVEVLSALNLICVYHYLQYVRKHEKDN